MSEHIVCEAAKLDDGDRIIVDLEGREIAIFNLDGEYRAYLNWCAHQGGPICEGTVTGRVEASFDRETLETDYEWTADDRTLVCPWHDWEFDLETGDCRSSDAVLPAYPVWVEDGQLKVRI